MLDTPVPANAPDGSDPRSEDEHPGVGHDATDERPAARRGADARPCLFESLSHDAQRTHPLSLERSEDGTWTIGRDAGASIVLQDDPEVSRRHALVRWHHGRFEVVDLATSRNGTWVNGEPLVKGRPRPLDPGDRIQLGSSELEFRL